MLHQVEKVRVEELSACLLIGCKLLQQAEQDVEPNLSNIPHGVLECPHYRVHQHLELRSRDLEVRWRQSRTW